MEAAISKLIEIGWIVLSFSLGFLSFYLFSEHSKEEKKKHIEEITSQLINLVLFIWLSKIILHISLFISDPVAVLAYPSDSHVFYLAIVFTILLLFYQSKRKKLHVFPLVDPFIYVIIVSSFVYEFIQFIIHDNSYAFGPFIVLAVVAAGYFLLRDKLDLLPFLMIIITVWSLGMIVLAITQPFVTVFGYIMTPWFIVVLYVGSMIGLLFRFKKK